MTSGTRIFRVATFADHGVQMVGLVLGEQAELVVDVERCCRFLKARGGDRWYLDWPARLDMLQVLRNWDYFLDRFHAIDARFGAGSLPGAGEADFAYAADSIRFRAPIQFPPKILNAGANYYDHCLEMGTVEISPERDIPYIFPTTPNNAVIGPGDPIKMPKSVNWDVAHFNDWEAELGVVIGRSAEDVAASEAKKYIAGYMLYQDISGRDKMIRNTGPFPWDWYANKCNDTFAPTGPWIVPQEFLPDTTNLRIRSLVNGEVEQDSSTSQMIWSPEQMLSYASEVTRLEPGDVIATGTPGGVGMAKGLRLVHGEFSQLFDHMYAGGGIFLKPGDTLVTEIEGIGTMANPIV